MDRYPLCYQIADTDFIVEGSECDATINFFDVKVIRDLPQLNIYLYLGKPDPPSI
jgi:hypothetical protein